MVMQKSAETNESSFFWKERTTVVYILAWRYADKIEIHPTRVVGVYTSKERLIEKNPEIDFRWINSSDSSMIAAYATGANGVWVVLERALV